MLYFTVELFIDALILVLYFNNAEVYELVNKLISLYEKESKETTYMDNEFFELYIHLIREISALGPNSSMAINNDSFLLKFKSNPLVVRDPELYTTLKNIFTDTSDISQERYKYLVRKLNMSILFYDNTKNVKKMFGKLATGASADSLDKQEAILSEMSELCSEIMKTNQSGLERGRDEQAHRSQFLDFSNKDSIVRAQTAYQTTSVTNVFKTGLQGLNRAFGAARGWRLGESIVYNSLSHHGKTMSLLKMARWQVTLNKVSEEFKNPTCIIYSLENETPQNLVLLFNELYINEFKCLPPNDMTTDQIAAYCHHHFNSLGWRLIIDRRLGTEFGFIDLVANFEEYISLGYTPLMCIIDYMDMLKKGSGPSDSVGNHLLLREVYTNICNYLKSKNCTLVTAHQLNRKAADSARTNPVGAVKNFGIDMLANGMDPQREIDVAFYQHKEYDTMGRAFMTYKLDKHRYNNDTPDSDKYFAYLFEGQLGILDDIHGSDKSTKNIYSVPTEETIPSVDIASVIPVSTTPSVIPNLFGEAV